MTLPDANGRPGGTRCCKCTIRTASLGVVRELHLFAGIGGGILAGINETIVAVFRKVPKLTTKQPCSACKGTGIDPATAHLPRT